MNSFSLYPTPLRPFDMRYEKGRLSDDYRHLPRPVGSLAYVMRGRGEYISGGRSFRVCPGDVILIPPGGTYLSRWESPPHLVGMHFELAGRVAAHHIVERLAPAGVCHADFLALGRERELSPGGIARFYSLLAILWERATRIPNELDPRIRPAVLYLDAYFSENDSVGELAALCSLSEPHFYALFRASLGISPLGYRRRLRVMQAERLLGTTHMPIGEIAASLGFSSEGYFRRIFREDTGCPPREYRRRELLRG